MREAGGTDVLTVLPARPRNMGFVVAPQKIINQDLDKRRIASAGLMSVEFLFIVYKMGHGLFDPAKAQTIMLFLAGPFSPAFWLVEMTVGIVLPIFILLYAVRHKNINGVLIAAVMVLIGYFVKRYDFVVATQVYPAIKNGLPSYLPAIMEVHLIAGIFGALLLTYTLGEKFLPLGTRK